MTATYVDAGDFGLARVESFTRLRDGRLRVVLASGGTLTCPATMVVDGPAPLEPPTLGLE